MFKRFAISNNTQVWITYGVLVGIVLVAMAFITRSSIVIESSRQAAESQAVRSRIHSENLKKTSTALRNLDQDLANLLIGFAKQFDRNADSGLAISNEKLLQFPIGDERYYHHCFFCVEKNGTLRIRSYQDKDFLKSHPDLRQVTTDTFPPRSWQSLLPPLLPGSDDHWAIDSRSIYQLNQTIAEQVPTSPNTNFPTTNMNGSPDPSKQSLIAGPTIPVWMNGELFLVRRYRDEENYWVEGCWLDWQKLRRHLESDLRIESQLQMVMGDRGLGLTDSTEIQLIPFLQNRPSPEDEQFFSNWIPLQLVIDFPSRRIPDFPADAGRLMLIFGWFCLIVTAFAIALLLRTVLRIGSHREAFASAVTHELRTPLTTFKLYADLLSTNPTPEKTKVYAETLQGEAERLGHLVENVLCYSRVEKRGITSHHRVTVVGDLLDSVTTRIQDHCQKRDAFFDTEITDAAIKDLEIFTDPNAVERILLNLADNACKYGKTGDGAMIDLKVLKDKKWLVLEISDHGPGLAGPQKKRLFKAYNHAAISTDSPYTSVGLGLAICYRLAKALGGKLTYRDNQPGCVFSLYLPLQH